MIISDSNAVPIASSITVSPDSSTQDISVIADGDFSSIFSDELTATDTVVTITFSTSQQVQYVAIAGSNVATKDEVTIDLTHDSGTASETITLGRDGNDVIVVVFDAEYSVSQIDVTIDGSGTLRIAEIAAGTVYEVPRGEQAGYKRPWTVPNKAVRQATNLDGTPVNLSYEARSLKVTLSVANNIMEDFDGWYDMLSFCVENTFYVAETDSHFEAYAGFNCTPAMTRAHSSTRKLGVSAMTFYAHAKLVD